MVSSRVWGRFAIDFAAMLLLAGGFSSSAHAVGQIVGTYKIALEVLMPKDNAAYKAGEEVAVVVRSSGFTGVKVTVKDTATGREEELKASLVKTEGTGSSAPKTWNTSWPTTGRKPGTYVFSVTGVSGSQAAPSTKSVTISVVQLSGPAKITFQEPAGGRQVKAGEEVAISLKAEGVSNVTLYIKDLQKGTEKERTAAHGTGTGNYMSSWSTEGLQKGSYQIIARGFGPDGKKLAEESVTMTVAGGATVLPPASAAKTVVVPNVIGMTEYDAVIALDKAGLKLNPSKYVSMPKPNTWGKVVDQSIKAGTKTAEPIFLTVGQK